MDSVDRFLKRKQLLRDIDEGYGLPVVVDQARVDQFLASEIDVLSIQVVNQGLNKAYDFTFNVDVSDQEAKELVRVLEKDFDDQKFNALLTACRNDVLSALIGPFGLGGLVASGDNNGGNVDTIRNVREGVFATEKERIAYESRGNYNSNEYHGHPGYISKNREMTEKQEAGTLVDPHTGIKIGRDCKKNLDHTIAAVEIHDDAGRALSELDGPSLANKDSNLNVTTENINKTKKQKSMSEYLDYVDVNIAKLKSKGNLSENEQKQLCKLEQQKKNIDPEKARAIDKKARDEYNNTINNQYYKGKKFIGNAAKTSAIEGGKMGLQQALGLVFCEFFKAIFDELKDIYDNGFSKGFEDDRFLHVLKERLHRIAKRIAACWKDAFKAFGVGFISGLLSNLVTVVINMFVRTGKRMVRIIREGFYSLLQAIKMLCFPQENMTHAQAAHAATKLIAAGLTVIGGIALEQHIDNMIKAAPLLEPFADLLTTVLVGGLTGLATTFIVYAIDKLDMFNVNDKEKHGFVMGRLTADLDRMFVEGDDLIDEMTLCYP